jgi:DNA repair ATPase RecN
MDDTIKTHTREAFALATSRADRNRSLDALHELELHAGSPSPGREQEWLRHACAALAALEQVLESQHTNSSDAESTLSDIERDEPRLRNRVVQLRRDYAALHAATRRLRAQLEVTPPSPGHIVDARQRLDRLATELRYQRAREADLVYEAYTVDLGAGD